MKWTRIAPKGDLIMQRKNHTATIIGSHMLVLGGIVKNIY